MELPPALFEDVTGQSAWNRSGPADEPPVANWVFLGQQAKVLRDMAGVGEDVCGSMIRRLSVQGVGLLHERPIPAGEDFTILLPRQGGAGPVPVRCTAVRCEAGVGGDGLYRVGAVFKAVLVEGYAGARRAGGRGEAVPAPTRGIHAATLAA